MKPKHAEIRRMVMLALGNWTDFLNTLNSILYSKSYLPDEDTFAKIYEESGCSDEVMEALFLISSYWERQSEEILALGTIGLRFSKPHTIFVMTLLAQYTDQRECARIVNGSIANIDSIEALIMTRKFCPSDTDPLEESRMYDRKMRQGLSVPDPLIRAGIELQLLRRGFTL